MCLAGDKIVGVNPFMMFAYLFVAI